MPICRQPSGKAGMHIFWPARIKYEKDFMLQLADIYQNNKDVQAECDSRYGEGVAEFFADAIRHFYEE